MRNEYDSQRFGVVLFENPESLGNGWACLSDDEPFYVQSPTDLFNNVYWLTNAKQSTLYTLHLPKNKHLKAKDYLYTPVETMIVETGLGGISEKETTRVMSRYFGAVMQLASDHLNIRGAQDVQLSNTIRKTVLPMEDPVSVYANSAVIDIVDKCAYNKELLPSKKQPFSGCTSVHLDRSDYAKGMLSTLIPMGRWTRLTSQQLTKIQRNPFDFIMGQRKPILVQVKSSALAMQTNLVINDEFTWISGPELLSYFAVGSVWIEDSMFAEDFSVFPVTMPRLSNNAVDPYVHGLYCQCLWLSLTRTLDGRGSKSMLSAWIYASNRLLCSKIVTTVYPERIIEAIDFGRFQVSTERASGDEGNTMISLPCEAIYFYDLATPRMNANIFDDINPIGMERSF